MRNIDRRLAALAWSLVIVASLASPSHARSEKTLAYPREQAWPAAVRFLAVDEHAKLTEKDADAGYVMFELREDRKIYRGSLEIVTLVRDGRTEVRFVLQIPDRPTYVEVAMLARLETKLRVELGSPSPPPAPKKDESKPDSPKGDDKPVDLKPDEGPRPGDGPRVSPTP